MRFTLLVLWYALTPSCLVACAEERPRCEAYHFHESFPKGHEDAARAALANWSAFSGKELAIVDGDPTEEACSFRAVAFESPAYVKLRDGADGDFFALHVDADGSIVIAEAGWGADKLCTDDVTACATFVLMHETGHEFGLQHVADPDAVMGTTNPAPRLTYTSSDRAECVRVGACRK